MPDTPFSNSELQAYLADPSAFAVAAPVEEAAAPAAEAAKEESESESDEDFGMDMFG